MFLGQKPRKKSNSKVVDHYTVVSTTGRQIEYAVVKREQQIPIAKLRKRKR